LLSVAAIVFLCIVSSNWTNITVTKSGLEWIIYHNGQLIDSFLAEVQPSSVLSSIVIGSSSYLAHDKDYFHGYMNNTQIWNISLTQEEIQAYMSCPPTGNEEGLVGYWNFNEISGDTVYDISGNGNHGIIYGGAEFSEDVPESFSGCVDENALNYDEFAQCDNGSCVFGDDVVSNLETSFDEMLIGLNQELDSTNSTLNNVIETWQTSIDLTNESLDAISGITQTLSSFNSVIDLTEGWNMIGYGCPESIDVSEGLVLYTDLVLICKDNNGSVYLPEFGFNGIVDFTPGYGYQLKISESIEGFSLCGEFTNVDNPQITDIETDNAQMQNDINCLTGNPQVGDYCYGGIVFYLDETGEHGLVAAYEDLSGTYEFGCYGVPIWNGGQVVGTGYSNSLGVVDYCSQSPIAATEALNYETGDYNDWYLPSIDELVEMYITIAQGGPEGNIGGFENNFYWSSSGQDNYTCWGGTFTESIVTVSVSRNGSNKVRPIRSF
jgi:hypothetical protein